LTTSGKAIGLAYNIHQIFKLPHEHYNKIEAFVLDFKHVLYNTELSLQEHRNYDINIPTPPPCAVS
jgi:hypothetical protein